MGSDKAHEHLLDKPGERLDRFRSIFFGRQAVKARLPSLQDGEGLQGRAGEVWIQLHGPPGSPQDVFPFPCDALRRQTGTGQN